MFFQKPNSRKTPKKSTKDKQGGSEDAEGPSTLPERKSRRDTKRSTSIDSPARKRKKSDPQRNLSSSSSRQSATALSPTDSVEELSQFLPEPSPSKRSSLRSNPGAPLLEGLTFVGRRRSSTKGKSPARKAPASKQQSQPQKAGQQRLSPEGQKTKKRSHSGREEPPQKGRSPRASRARAVREPSAEEQGPSRPPSGKRQHEVNAGAPSTRAEAESQRPEKPKRNQKRKLSSTAGEQQQQHSQQPPPQQQQQQQRREEGEVAPEASTSVEGSGGLAKRAKKGGARASSSAATTARRRTGQRKPSGQSQANTGACASTRRRAASKEGGRIRSLNAVASTTASSNSNNNNVNSNNTNDNNNSGSNRSGAPNPTMNDQDGRQAEPPAAQGEAAEGGGVGTDNAEAGTSSVGSFATSLSFEQDSDVGRLQALLEARGVPSHLFGTLGPRMHQILQRTVLGSSVYKVQVILQNLQSKDENQQFSAAIEMCQLLVMGNEDTLAGFPTRQVVPALIGLLKGNPLDEMGTNFDVMHHACRALTYMMEALPRSSSVVVEAVPVFLEKLQSIQCMDVAEQSLQALEMLSKKHHKAILHANGVASCLMFLDFFSLPAQRTALSITANCCQSLTVDEFNYVRSSLPTLANLLTQQPIYNSPQDKKLLESVCLSMSRLVDNFHSDENIIREVAAEGFLHNTLGLLVASPPLISSTMFVTVVHMLASMCATCPDLAVKLLNLKIADALCSLLVTMNQGASLNVELTPRNPQELYELVCLIGELMPKLPTDGIFSIDRVLKKSYGSSNEGAAWHWLDDHGIWHQYTLVDSRIIESALQANEREVNLCIFGVNYTVDFESMQQINEDTGTTRHVKRKSRDGRNSSRDAGGQSSKADARETALKSNPELGDSFIKTLFGVLYEVYNSSAGSSIRHKCLQALMRIIYYGNAEPLKSVLPMCNVSSHIAAMMASSDLKIVVVSIQMAFVLVEKLPEVFNVHFCREGVMHQIRKLRDLPPTGSSAALPAPDAAHVPGLPNPPAGLEVMDLSTSTPAAGVLQMQPGSHPMLLSTLSNSNHNNGRSTRSAAGFSHQSLLGSLMPPPAPQGASGTFRPSFVHVTPHLSAQYGSLPPPPPPYPAFHVFQEPVVEFQAPPPPPIPARPFLQGQLDATSSSLGTAGRSSPVSPRLKISNVLKHKKAASRRLSSGKSGKVPALGMPQTVPANQGRPLAPQILQMPGFYVPGQQQPQPQQGATHSELHGLLGEVDHLRQNRWGGAKPSGFLQGLKWNKGGRQANERPSSPLPQGSVVVAGHHLPVIGSGQQMFQNPAFGLPPPPPPQQQQQQQQQSVIGTPVASNDSREKVRLWICEQATKFCEKYYGEQTTNSMTNSALSCLNQLCYANGLLLDEVKGVEGLRELSKIMLEEDVSPFEMIHSGILDSLLAYLTPPAGSDAPQPAAREVKARVAAGASGAAGDVSARYERAKTFLAVFLGTPTVKDGRAALNPDVIDTRAFQSLVAKLMACFHHLEQFQVKVHDLPAGSNLSRGGNNAIRFFDTHQIKCNLQRHPTCTTLKQWKGGPVKIDPLALVQAIERYLLLRGFARARQGGEDDDDDEDDASDDEEIDEGLGMPSTSNHPVGPPATPAAVAATTASGAGRRHQQQQHQQPQQPQQLTNQQQQHQQQHSIEFVLNDRTLPYNMTVYEAVRQFGSRTVPGRPTGQGVESEAEGDWEGSGGAFGANCIWTNTHTIYYRPVSESSSNAARNPSAQGGEASSSPKKAKADRSKSKAYTKAIKELDLGRCSSLDQALDLRWISTMTFKDPSLKVLPLLSILNALSRHWGILFEKLNTPPLLSNQDFQSSKLMSKANRQLQDPLSIMTGDLPPWLGQMAKTCSFLLSFETRQLLFYTTSFDRERAMHRVQRESNQDQGSSSENNDRVVPRLERRKATISRDDVLKQAERLINDMSNYKALLEIQYENEVGTGLGPTMEFYALISRELQRHDLELWGGDPVPSSEGEESKRDGQVQYTFSPCGLFPSPIPKSTRAAQVNKIRAKFKFLGKFMAKALMDSRMLDLPLSKSLYKWMLSPDGSRLQNLCLSDLDGVLPNVSKFVQQLLDVLRQKKKIEADQSHTSESRSLALNSLTFDGCSFEDLDVDFCLPGRPDVEMKKGGRDATLTLDNAEEYLRLLVHWALREGPGRQLESLREGFDSVFPMSHLALFYPEEMEALFCGGRYERWTPRYLAECCRVDHGYVMDSRPIGFLFEVLSSFDADEQRLFVQFTTGSPKLPVGGLKSLNPPLTIVRKSVENNDNPDNYLPSVMTCVNYFKLPEYSSMEVTRQKLLLATREGQKSFHLS